MKEEKEMGITKNSYRFYSRGDYGRKYRQKRLKIYL